MPTQVGDVKNGCAVRRVRFDIRSRRAWRESISAGGFVYLGKFESLSEAKKAALKDMALGPRIPGDLSRNRTKSISLK